jgi:hypothetical protein
LLSVLKRHAIRRPLILFGIPSLIFLSISIIFGKLALDYFNINRQLPTNLLIISGMSLIISIILATTGLLIFILVSLIREEISKSR